MTNVALILGGAGGIGAASALRLAEQGHMVAIADLRADQAARIVAGLPGNGHFGVECDIANEASVRSCFERVENHLGAIRVLVVAAGNPALIDGKRPKVRDTSLESWSLVMGVNATGPFLAMREMFERREQRPVENGRIITMSSIAAQVAPRNAPIAYAASKAAVLAITRVAAVGAAPLGMTANAVAPGMIDTPMFRGAFPDGDPAFEHLTGPIGQPSDIAATVCFLASPAASFINGACIDVNGGFVMR
jgi:3-oxoacyl-[acyl-carrier protein] reductase